MSFEKSLHIRNEVEEDLTNEALRISEKYGGNDVMIIVGGHQKAQLDRSMIGATFFKRSYMLRDLLGLLEVAKQLTMVKHFGLRDIG